MESVGLVWLERGHWGLTTAIYLFFAAVGGGAYLAGIAAYGLGDGERDVRMEFARWAFLSGLVAVAIAGVAILSHLASPLAGLLFPITLSNFGSWITRGTWILVTLGVFTAIQTLWFHFGTFGTETPGASTFVRRIAGAIGLQTLLDGFANGSRPGGNRYWAVALVGVLPALGTVYTGFELAAVTTVPIWNNTVLLPAVFLASGIAAGIAVPLAATVVFEGASSRVVGVFSGLVGVALLVTAGLLWGLWNAVETTPAASESLALLTSGGLSTVVSIVAIGTVVSLVAVPVLGWIGYARSDSSISQWVVRPGLVGALTLAVVSSFLLRYALLFAAVKEPIVVVGL